MLDIGRSLKFYLTHFFEMDEIYCDGEDSILLKDNDNKDEIISLVDRIGNEAHEQALNLLEELSPKVITILKTKCDVKGGNKKTSIKTNWRLDFYIWPKSCPFNKYKNWQLCVHLNEYLGNPSVYIYLWTNSKDKKERARAVIYKVFNKKYRKNVFSSNIIIDILPLKLNGNKFKKNELFEAVLGSINKLHKPDYKQIFGV